MSDIQIEYELVYLHCDLADERVENQPFLRAFLDGHFERSESGGGVVDIKLDEHDFKKKYKSRLTGNIRGRALVPATACIGFASYAMRRNEFGMACYTHAGTTHIRLGDINSNGYSVEKPLLMEPTRMLVDTPIEKGRIRFTVTKIKMPKLDQISHCIMNNLRTNEDTINQFISRRINFEASLADTWPGIKNVRAPMDLSSAGIELTGSCFIPVEGYALQEAPQMNVLYFQNAMERQMRRKNLNNPRADFKSLDHEQRCELMAELVTYAAQSFDYISDTVDMSSRTHDANYDISKRQMYDHWGGMSVTASGDCEDSAGLEQVHFKAFMALAIDSKLNPELHELQQIGKNYVFFLTLATVHGAKAEDNTEHIGAHMYGLLLPKSQVKATLSTNATGADWANRLPLQMTDKKVYPTLFTEGTGRIRPLGTGPWKSNQRGHKMVQSALKSYDPLYNERRYISANMKTKGGLKMEIPHDAGAPSNFYLGNLMIVTSEFMDLGYNVGSFICGNLNTSSNTFTRGSHFTDLINQRDTVTLIPYEPLPDNVMQITREATMLREPPRPFMLSQEAYMRKEKHPELERLKTHVEKLGRQDMRGRNKIQEDDDDFDLNFLKRLRGEEEEEEEYEKDNILEKKEKKEEKKDPFNGPIIVRPKKRVIASAVKRAAGTIVDANPDYISNQTRSDLQKLLQCDDEFTEVDPMVLITATIKVSPNCIVYLKEAVPLSHLLIARFLNLEFSVMNVSNSYRQVTVKPFHRNQTSHAQPFKCKEAILDHLGDTKTEELFERMEFYMKHVGVMTSEEACEIDFLENQLEAMKMAIKF